MKYVKIKAGNPSKAELNKVIKAMQLYLGSLDYAQIKDQQRLRNALDRQIDKIAKKTGMSDKDVWDQTEEFARRKGIIKPIPGRDY